MSKFRVGDKVRKKDSTAFSGGDMVDEVGEWNFDWEKPEYAISLKNSHTWIGEEFVEHVTTNTLQVGQTYTSENGDEWECIFVRGGKAWMAELYSGVSDGAAYLFDIDGTNISQGGGSYNIKWGPKRETVKTRFSVVVANKYALDGVDNHVANITFELIDGTPDWTTAKVTPCD